MKTINQLKKSNKGKDNHSVLIINVTKKENNNNFLKNNNFPLNLNKKYTFNPKHSNNSSLKNKELPNLCRNKICNNQLNNAKNKNNFNKNNEKEEGVLFEVKKNIEHKKYDEIFNLKSEINTMKNIFETNKQNFLKFMNITANNFNEIGKDKSLIENKFKNIDNNFCSINENLKRLNKKSEENIYSLKIENIENFLKKILSEIGPLKKKINYNNNLIYPDTNENFKNEFIKLKNKNEKLKGELDNSDLNFHKTEKDSIKNQNEEITEQKNELKIIKSDIKNQKSEIIKINEKLEKIIKQNEDHKNQNDQLLKQNQELTKFYEEIKTENKELMKRYENLIKENEEIKKQSEEILDKNKELQKQNEFLKKENEELKQIKEEKWKQIGGFQYNNHIMKRYGIVGLINIGNSCYMNSILQTLKNIPQFTYNIIKLNDGGDNFLIELKNLFRNLCLPDVPNASPKEFKKYLVSEKLGQMFAGNNQNDSSLFYISLLNLIDKKLNKEKIKKIDMSKYREKTLKERIKIYKENDYKFKNETFIFDIFYIYYVNKIKCKSCKDVTHIFQKMNFFDFPIVTVNGNVKSLEECFENYQKIKDVKDTCSKCKSFGTTHEFILLDLPPVLMINLKRVGEQSAYFNDIEIPHELNMEKIIKNFIYISTSTYELRAFIKHEGDEKSGHNYAFCKNMFDNLWYEYNDSLCKDIIGEPNLNTAFFLCYIKKGNDMENINYLEKIVNSLNNQKKDY